MLDPIPPPSPWLVKQTMPLADMLHLPSLPYHIHEVLFAALFYQSIQSFISPYLSAYLFPNIYPKFNTRTRVNWDVHVVSLVQSLLINALALYVMFADGERKDMTSWVERVYGYTGACGLIQGLACGYFVWDIVVSTRYFRIFGAGIWAHAVTALMVFSFGFRPYCNYYGPAFILYELSSPFLNIHWFCDKLNMTGSKLQWYNGMVLLVTFAGSRLFWGTYQSIRVYIDTWAALNSPATGFLNVHNITNPASAIFVPRNGDLCLGDQACVAAQAEVMKYTTTTKFVPLWLAGTYLVCNLTLNVLNWHWYGRMIETVMKRFQGKDHDEFKGERDDKPRRPSIVEEAATELDIQVMSGAKTPKEELVDGKTTGSTKRRDGGPEINKRRRG